MIREDADVIAFCRRGGRRFRHLASSIPTIDEYLEADRERRIADQVGILGGRIGGHPLSHYSHRWQTYTGVYGAVDIPSARPGFIPVPRPQRKAPQGPNPGDPIGADARRILKPGDRFVFVGEWPFPLVFDSYESKPDGSGWMVVERVWFHDESTLRKGWTAFDLWLLAVLKWA